MTEGKPRVRSSYFSNTFFTLSMGNLTHDLNGEIFSKMSKKCATLLRQGITSKELLRQVTEDTFNTFISACQTDQFKVTAKNAFELLYLAKDWEIPALEKFTNEYIQSKGLEAPESIDYLQVLIDKSAERNFTIGDVKNVAATVNEYMADERFTTLPPEVIFQVLMAADPTEIDPDGLLQLTFSLFNAKPSSAVPTTTLDDFEKLTKEQRHTLIRSEKMNGMNINYFVAWALSRYRNYSKFQDKALQGRVQIRIAELADSAEKARQLNEVAIENQHVQDIADLHKQLEEQEAEIAQLLEEIEADKEAFAETEAKRQEELLQAEQEVQGAKDHGDQSQLFTLDQNEQVNKLISEELQNLRAELEEKIDEAGREQEIKCREVLCATQESANDPADAISEIETKFASFKDQIETLNSILLSNRSTLTAKMIRDKIRCDEFIRDNDRMLEIFNRSSLLWDLTPQQVQQSDEMIEDFERDLNQLCPIRGNTQFSPPPSSKASPIKASNRTDSQTGNYQLNEELFDEEEEEEEEMEEEEEEAMSVTLSNP